MFDVFFNDFSAQHGVLAVSTPSHFIDQAQRFFHSNDSANSTQQLQPQVFTTMLNDSVDLPPQPR